MKSSMTFISFRLWIQCPPHLPSSTPHPFDKIPGFSPSLTIISFGFGLSIHPIFRVDHLIIFIRSYNLSLWSFLTIISFGYLISSSLQQDPRIVSLQSSMIFISIGLWIQSFTSDHFDKISGSIPQVILDYHLLPALDSVSTSSSEFDTSPL